MSIEAPPYGDPNFCAFHHEIETPGTIRCPECWHWFADESAVEADLLRRWGDTLPFAEIHACPWCTHDF